MKTIAPELRENPRPSRDDCDNAGHSGCIAVCDIGAAARSMTGLAAARNRNSMLPTATA
jgi:hypothetical protein